MKQTREYNFKKRKRLERDYCEYSKDNIPHTLQGEYDVKYARNFHDRAITCIDLANIYLQNGMNEAALIYVENGVEDLKRAVKIYKKIQSNNSDAQKCLQYISVFKTNIQTIKSTIKQSAISETETPPQATISNTEPLHQEIALSPLRETIFKKPPECSPVKSKESNITLLSVEKKTSIDYKNHFTILGFN
jgi:hypothetical protein